MLNAVYTMCYKDVLEIAPSLLDDIVWDTTEHTDKLKEMIYAKFFNYEISGETIPEQKLFMKAKFDEYKDYYSELLSAYEHEIEWLDGIITSEEYSGSNENTKTFTPRSKYQTTDTPAVVNTTEEYDLPRSASSENRPSSKRVTTPSGTATSVSEGVDGNDQTKDDGSASHSITRKMGNPIEQKKEYLKLIRSVYSEFADKFKPCFLTLFN